jgi:GTP-dependent dephospho-CoA kinase
MDYFAPDEKERAELKKPLGRLYTHTWDAKELKGKIIAVGDFVSHSLIKAGIYPDLVIVDGLVEREKTQLKIEGYQSVKVKNPAGRVTKELWDAVKKAVEGKIPLKIEVDGEEDLAVMPAVMLAPLGAKIAYGQPKEGIVVATADLETKEKVGAYLFEYQVKEGKRFLEGLGKKETVMIIHHSDADGCTSAAILKKALLGKGVEQVEAISPVTQPYITKEIREMIEKKNPSVLIMADMGNGDLEYLREESNRRRIAVFDHHKIFADIGELLIVNPCKANIPDTMNPSASYVTWRACGDAGTGWLAVVGAIGDKGEKKIGALLDETKARYGISMEELKKCAQILDAAEAFEPGGANIVVSALMRCSGPKDLLEGNAPEIKELRGKKDKIEEEIQRISDAYVGKANERLIVYGIETKYGIKGDVANVLQERYPHKIVLVYIETKGQIRVSMRTNADADIATAIKKALGPHGRGGGHPKASGAEMPKEGFNGFLERLRHELGVE